MQQIAKTFWAALVAEVLLGPVAAPVAAADAPRVSFIRQVAPILIGKCQGCHGPKTAESSYRLDTFELLMKAGDFGSPPVTAGNLEDSELHRLIMSEDPDERMPNNGDRLSAEEIALINSWILQGATFDGADPAAALRSQVPPDVPHPAAPATYSAALPITAMAFSPDGSQLVVGGYHELLVWDSATGELTARVGNIPQRTFGMAFSPDGSCLAIAGGASGVSGEVRLAPWANGAPNGDTPKVLVTGDDVFFDVAFRPDGKQLVAGAYDGSVRVFETASGAERLKINNHADWVTDVCYSSDGTLIASASRDKSAKVFDAETGQLVASVSDPAAPVRGVAFAPDGKAVITASGNLVRMWKVEDSTQVAELPPLQGEVQALLAVNDDLFAASTDRTARQFKLADRKLVRAFAEQPAWVLSFAASQPTRRVATGCFNGVVTVWNQEDGSVVKQFLAAPPKTAPAK